MPMMNMGQADRVARGVAGAFLISGGGPLRKLLGGMLLYNSLSGNCGMLSATGYNTIPGHPNNVLNQFKKALPGQGINPMLTQQPLPRHPTKSVDPSAPVSSAMTVG